MASTPRHARTAGGAVVGVLLRVVLPLVDLLTSVVAFAVTLTLLVLSVGLVPLFLLGLPTFTLTGAVARGLARLERRRLAFFLDVRWPQPPPAPHGFRASIKDAPTWRAICYQTLVQLPLAVASFSVVVSLDGASLTLISMPWWLRRVPTRRADLGFFQVTDQRAAWLMCALGFVVGLIGLAVAYGFGSLDAAVARGLLGTSQAELARRVDVLQETRARVVDAAEAERRRIERDLHDGAQQRLVALAMNLGRARARYDDDPEAARRLLDEAHTDAKQALVELRDLARGLHPAVLTDRGLDAALSGLAARSPVPVTLDVDVERRCSATIEAIAYFVVSEALANVAKHSRAQTARVSVRRAGDRLRVAIADDGIGGAHAGTGSGLTGLADRVAGVDGYLHIESPVGGPTKITVELPCES